jgi:hypothetical protein
MQTFLPYPDFYKSGMVLDPSRLGNQVYRECKTLITGGWKNHPAYKMWKGHEYALAEYSLALLKVLQKDRGRFYPHHIEFFLGVRSQHENTGLPSWVGNENFHKSHRANLKRKALENPEKYLEWYKIKLHDFDDLDETMEYIWPV